MYRIESNYDEFINAQLIFLDALDPERSNSAADRAMREACTDSMALISQRVQNRGEKTDGSKITSKAGKKLGAYSYQYGKKRQSTKTKSSHQIDIIDLTFSGDMFNSLTFEPQDGVYNIGFAGEKEGMKAEYNEERFGEIFSLSDDEFEFVMDKLFSQLSSI